MHEQRTRTWLLLACVFLVLLAVPGSASREADLLLPGGTVLGPEALREHPAPFAAPVGEALTYAFTYWGIPIGEATVRVERLLEVDGRRVAHVISTARSNDAFSIVYPVEDRAEAWIDIDAMRTVKSRSAFRHRKREIYEELDFDWDTHFLRVLRERRHSKRGRELHMDFGPYAHDPIDLLYLPRNYPDDQTLTLPVYASKKIYGLRLEPEANEELEAPAFGGPVTTQRYRPQALLDGKPKREEGRGLLWVTADERRLPVLMVGWFRGSDTFRVGGLRIELTGYVAADPGWESTAAQEVRRERPAPPTAPQSIEGKPVWQVPERIATLRAQRGVTPSIRRYRLAGGDVAQGPKRAEAQQAKAP